MALMSWFIIYPLNGINVLIHYFRIGIKFYQSPLAIIGRHSKQKTKRKRDVIASEQFKTKCMQYVGFRLSPGSSKVSHNSKFNNSN